MGIRRGRVRRSEEECGERPDGSDDRSGAVVGDGRT